MNKSRCSFYNVYMNDEKDEKSEIVPLMNLLPYVKSAEKELRDNFAMGEWTDKQTSIEKGKALRKEVSRKELGDWQLKTNREKKVSLVLEDEKDRIQRLLPVRHERMSASPFAFFRGSALLMASDLSECRTTGINVQACGDAHIANFGIFASPERRLVFDINDFDETLTAPWDYDVRRLMASIEICGRDRGFSKGDRMRILNHAAEMYQTSMKEYASMGTLDVWYDHMDLEKMLNDSSDLFSEELKGIMSSAMKKAVARNSGRAIRKLTERADGKLRIRSNPPLVVPVRDIAAEKNLKIKAEEAKKMLGFVLKQYRLSLPKERRHLIDQYRVVDAALKVVGVGSVGTRDWMIVMEGTDEEDPLVLQVKEAGESCLERYVGKSEYVEHGRRIIEGQRAIQTAGDILIGWVRTREEEGKIKDYYIRQLWDAKGSVDLSSITEEDLDGYAALCARTLAHAHAKTGNRYEIAGYVGKGRAFREGMTNFAVRYADQNDADYQVFLQMVGREKPADYQKAKGIRYAATSTADQLMSEGITGESR